MNSVGSLFLFWMNSTLSFLHKIRSTGEPQALASKLQANVALRSRNTRQDTALALPRIKTESGRRRFLYHIVQMYNALPPEMKDQSIASYLLRLSGRVSLVTQAVTQFFLYFLTTLT